MKPPLLLLILLAGFVTWPTHAADRPNVLFIAIDDLNHWVGHLGRNRQTKTPNIDRLARRGVTFTRAYCTAPACNPSRASLMSGQRPSTTGCYLNGENWRPGISEDKLLNSHLAKAGYLILGAGKIYHGAADRGGHWDDYFAGHGQAQRHPAAKNDGVGGIRFYPLAGGDEQMPDYKIVSYGLAQLQKNHDRPFFLAIGLAKPHMPFAVPKKWFDLFPLESIELPPHRPDDLDDVPPAGVRMARPQGDHAAILKSGRWKEAVQAYLATIAFADAQVGRLLDGLDKSAYRDNTIVVLWSDHGWSLGEKSHWRKFALWEEPTRTVFVWSVPGVTRPGGVCSRTVDYTSVFPTLCSLTGVSLPVHLLAIREPPGTVPILRSPRSKMGLSPSPKRFSDRLLGLEGRDITPLLKDPSAPWDIPAITTHGRGNHAVRSERWRYIRYANGDEELYDTSADPLEYTNLAARPEHAARKAELAQWLPKKEAPNLPSAPRAAKTKKRPNARSAGTR